jgi:hypothetical protein
MCHTYMHTQHTAHTTHARNLTAITANGQIENNQTLYDSYFHWRRPPPHVTNPAAEPKSEPSSSGILLYMSPHTTGQLYICPHTAGIPLYMSHHTTGFMPYMSRHTTGLLLHMSPDTAGCTESAPVGMSADFEALQANNFVRSDHRSWQCR